MFKTNFDRSIKHHNRKFTQFLDGQGRLGRDDTFIYDGNLYSNRFSPEELSKLTAYDAEKDLPDWARYIGRVNYIETRRIFKLIKPNKEDGFEYVSITRYQLNLPQERGSYQWWNSNELNRNFEFEFQLKLQFEFEFNSNSSLNSSSTQLYFKNFTETVKNFRNHEFLHIFRCILTIILVGDAEITNFS